LWMRVFLMPADVRRYFMLPLLGFAALLDAPVSYRESDPLPGNRMPNWHRCLLWSQALRRV